jgi:hypothetical protein
VKIVERADWASGPEAAPTRIDTLALNASSFTRRTRLERIWAAIIVKRFPAWVPVAVTLVAVGILLVGSRGDREQASLRRDRAQIAGLIAQRDQAVAASISADRAEVAWQSQASRWRALAQSRSRADVGRFRVRHNNAGGRR